MRNLYALISGGLFGIGLTISGMIDTTKVQGWLDVFGDWDPTLAFVMGGAIFPMTIAWMLTKKFRAPLAGGSFPPPTAPFANRSLIVGSALFGMGWALVGLCPGPSFAAIFINGLGGLVFIGAMAGGMLLAPRFKVLLDEGDQ